MKVKTPLRFTVSIRVIVVALVAFAIFVTAAAAISLQYYFSRQMAIEHELERYRQTAVTTGTFIETIERRAEQVSRLLARYPALQAVETAAQAEQVRDLFAEVLGNHELFYSIYLGFPDGDIFEVVNLHANESMLGAVKAVEGDRWVINWVRESDHGRIRELYYYDSDFNLRERREEPSHYDVRQRRWYNESGPARVRKSAPYMFQYIQAPGQTYSVQLPDSKVVLGIDITLNSFSQYLNEKSPGGSAQLFVYDGSGAMLGSNLLRNNDAVSSSVKPLALSKREREYLDSLGPVRVSNELDWAPIDFAEAGRPKGYTVDLMRLLGEKLQLKMQFINGYRWTELIEKFSAGELDVLQPITSSGAPRRFDWVGEPLAQLPFAIATRKNSAPVVSIAGLAGQRVAAPAGWNITNILRDTIGAQHIVEVENTQQALRAVQAGRADAAVDNAVVLRHMTNELFLDNIAIGPALLEEGLPETMYFAVHPDKQKLLGLLNLALLSVTDEEWRQLEQKWLSPDAQAAPDLARVPYLFLLTLGRDASSVDKILAQQIDGVEHFVLVSQIATDEGAPSYFAAVVPAAQVLAKPLGRVRNAIWVSALCLLLVLPLVWLLSRPIVRPILALSRKSELVKERRFNEVAYTPTRVTELNELAVSMTEMAGSICSHEESQRLLMDSFIQLIAEAIDEKSPYTGGHCARVPELGLMLARAAHESSEPDFESFEFASDEQWREFKIAAWLHDCGKITVPEYVVDKSVKLETIYNRIHEVRTRFEVLLRDAELHYWQALARGGKDEAELAAQRDARIARLHADFAFVANANIGGEYMSDDDIARLQSIAAQTWQRHFDRRLGLSAAELARTSKMSEPLPATERLLEDRPEHVVERTCDVSFAPHLGINMNVPEQMFNHGELYNLSISRGTLTPEERYKINEHMVSTIKMLDRLPFPPELARVPRYASTHHEAVDGTGYPRKLTGDQLSIPEKVLVVADIFEALTAADRPYKEAKSIAAAIDIMANMVASGHIDKSVFELFLTSGVYLQYAHEYLSAEQIVEIDIQRYLSN